VSEATFETRARLDSAEYEDLGVFEKGRLSAELEAAILNTAPGHISAVVRTPFGAHVIYRPTFAQVRDKVIARDRPATVQRAQKAYIAAVDSVGRTRLVANAVATVRAVASEPDAHRGDTTLIARTAVRDLTAARLVSWLDVFPPAMAGQVVGAPDSIVKQFVGNLVGYEVMLRSSDSAGVVLDTGSVAKLVGEYRGEITRAWAAARVDPRVLADSAPAMDGRRHVAAWRAGAYVDSLFAPRSRVRFVALSPMVQRVVRARYPAQVDSGQVTELVARLRNDKRRADSARDTKLPQSAVPMPKQ
jgi:hypothetical protein